jgi:isocitrate/isopropylmalate dehydrogenase
MLDHLQLGQAAELIRHAVGQILQSGEGTLDLGGNLTTVEMGDRLVAEVIGS